MIVQITVKLPVVLNAQTKSLVAISILWKWFIYPKVIAQWIFIVVEPPPWLVRLEKPS